MPVDTEGALRRVRFFFDPIPIFFEEFFFYVDPERELRVSFSKTIHFFKTIVCVHAD